MKKDCFVYLTELCKIGRSLWKDMGNSKAILREELLQKSESLTKQCLSYANNMLITPIDREDIVSISLSLHRFNEATLLFVAYKEKFYPNLNVNKYAEVIKSICEIICGYFENGLVKHPENYWERLPHLPSPEYENRFSPLSLVTAQELFRKMEGCYSRLIEIYDSITLISIKNS